MDFLSRKPIRKAFHQTEETENEDGDDGIPALEQLKLPEKPGPAMQPVRLIFDRHDKTKDKLGKSAFDGRESVEKNIRKVNQPDDDTLTETDGGNQSDYDPMALFRGRNNPAPVPPPGAKKWDSRDIAPKRHFDGERPRNGLDFDIFWNLILGFGIWD